MPHFSFVSDTKPLSSSTNSLLRDAVHARQRVDQAHADTVTASVESAPSWMIRPMPPLVNASASSSSALSETPSTVAEMALPCARAANDSFFSKLTRQAGFGQHFGFVVAHPHDLQRAVPRHPHAVVAAQALYAQRDAAVIAEMEDDVGLHLVVGPLARAVRDDAFAARLRDAEARRKAFRQGADAIHPGHAPEIAFRPGPAQRKAGRAVPAQIVDKQRAVGAFSRA